MKPNTPTLAITTGLIVCSPGPSGRYHFPMNIDVQRCAALLGFTYFTGGSIAARLRSRINVRQLFPDSEDS